jgi:hypothetical protein
LGRLCDVTPVSEPLLLIGGAALVVNLFTDDSPQG